MNNRCCNDFTRSKILHKAVAEAGRGLPSIEPGMPLPAGTGMSRHSFLLRSAGLALTVYGIDKIKPGLLEEGVARAAGPANPIFVSIFLEGGADGLSLMYMPNDATYVASRPKLKIPDSAGIQFTEDNRLYWHPSLAPFATLHGQGKVVAMPAIGYADPDQSHFTSRHYWEVGAEDAFLGTGWLGRYLDVVGTADNPLQGLSLDGDLSPTLATASVPVAAIDAPASYDLGVGPVWDPVSSHMLDAMKTMGERTDNADTARTYARTVTLQSHRLYEQLDGFSDTSPPVTYPDGQFGQQLASLAALIAAGLPLQCVALSASGSYDTHSSEADSLTGDLANAAGSIAAFQADLEARGIADRVLMHVWSEFGRRIEENGSQGTDHGAAGCGFLIGTGVTGTMVGPRGDLATTGQDADGNLVMTCDFRGLYCSIIEQWFDQDATPIIPNASSFTRYTVIK
jgi:uncharacterized protein (DUF1501 family)